MLSAIERRPRPQAAAPRKTGSLPNPRPPRRPPRGPQQQEFLRPSCRSRLGLRQRTPARAARGPLPSPPAAPHPPHKKKNNRN